MEPDKVLIDIATCDLALTEVMGIVRDYQDAHPEEEVFMDGDAYAIVARERGCVTCLPCVPSMSAILWEAGE